jgi:predicted transcriptional regulator
MTEEKAFHNLFFELSNEDRYGILLVLQKKAMRITDIAKEMDINNPEARRHLTRLSTVSLIKRDVEGLYHLTPYGETCLLLFDEFDFLSSNREYFKTHTLSGVPDQYIKRVGELKETRCFNNALDFFRFIEKLFRESKEYVWLLVDQFPMNSLTSIIDSIERGVKLRFIETRDRVLNPDLDALSSEESHALSRTRGTPLVEQRMIDEVDLCMFISDSLCVFAFPTSEGKFDYIGFVGTDKLALNWCRELYNYYWDEAETRKSSSSDIQVERGRIRRDVLSRRVVVDGMDDPRIDAQVVQDAVDNYEEVLLRGKFNFGASMVSISRSVVIRGDGRENDIPQTIIYQQGWSFPFREWSSIFMLDGLGIDVSIENIHFTDFNCACIQAYGASIQNSLKLLDNRITLPYGYGRGMMLGSFGDVVHGILAEGIGDGGVHIEGNYIDLAIGGFSRGVVSRGGIEEDPEFRPDLFNHEYFIGFGIAVNGSSGRVFIQNNVVRNANGRGIASSSNSDSAEVFIRENVVESDVYGSYPFSSRESGAGILTQTGLGEENMPGFYVCIENNRIKLDKLNQSGIIVLGPVDEGSSKLHGGVIQDNVIHLKNGYEGIRVRKCDEFQVTGNKVIGEAYYGVHVSGHKVFGDLDMSSIRNQFEENDLQELKIKEPDDYVLNHSDDKMFSKSEPRTAHYWLSNYTKNNKVYLPEKISVIDEGENNNITQA